MRFSLRTLMIVVLLFAVGMWVWLNYRRTLIKPGELLQITVVGTLLGQGIDGMRLVDDAGMISLGPAYGTVKVQGLNINNARSVVEAHLKKMLRQPEVELTRAGDDNVYQELIKLRAENRKLTSEVSRLKSKLSAIDKATKAAD